MYITVKQLSQRYNVKELTIWRWLKTDPSFPKPVKLSPGCTRWKQAEIEAWEQSREVAA